MHKKSNEEFEKQIMVNRNEIILANSEKSKIYNDQIYLEKMYRGLEESLKESTFKLQDNELRINNNRKEKTELERELAQFKIKTDQYEADNKNLKNEINCLETQISSINHA